MDDRCVVKARLVRDRTVKERNRELANEFDYFPLFYRQLLIDTADMTTLEFGAYMRLLLHAWDQQPAGTLPSDGTTLARIARVAEDTEWSKVSRAVLSRFKPGGKGRIRQKKMCEVYADLQNRAKSKRDSGINGAKARWDKNKHANALRSHTDRNANKSKSNESNHIRAGEKEDPPKDPDPDPLVVQARDYIDKHPLLPIWSQRMQDDLVELVKLKPWPYVETSIDNAIASKEPDPIGEVLKRLRKAGGSPPPPPPPRRKSSGPTFVPS
jgi:uncharacterized protein YdaU (DUF1376 family)